MNTASQDQSLSGCRPALLYPCVLIATFCDQFMISEMPVLGLAACQRKDVAQRLRRGVSAFDDGKPRVVANVA
jgi:hypothetical protein